MYRRIGIIIIILMSFNMGIAQQDSSLLDLLGEEKAPTEYVDATFKGTRIINSQSIENVYKGVLDFRIAHRFGSVNRGIYDLFGLDQASMKLNFDYGITRWLTVGLGRSNVEKTYDGFAKIKVFRQTATNKMPIGIVVLGGTSVSMLNWAQPTRKNYFTSRMSYFSQVIFARKFNESFSLQLMPSMVHYNLIADNTKEQNDHYFLGIALRQKLTKRTSINVEYFYAFNPVVGQTRYNSLSIGFDLETGGHVFQLHFTNSLAMHERGFMSETSESWLKGGIHFGFNISRVFTINSNH